MIRAVLLFPCMVVALFVMAFVAVIIDLCEVLK